VPISTFLNNRVPTRLRGLQFLALSDSAAIPYAICTSPTVSDCATPCATIRIASSSATSHTSDGTISV